MNKGFVEFLKGNKKARVFLLLLAIGIILILASSTSTEKRDIKGESLDEYRERLETELAEVCSDVEGVGKCKVFITFERGAQSTYKGSVLLETKPPKVLGVTVVCKGADSDYVKQELVTMLSALFNIGTNRIAVLKLNS